MKISWIESDALAASGIPLDKKDMVSLQEQGIRAIINIPLRSRRKLHLIY